MFGGVFALVRYLNLASAVRKVLQARQRIEQDGFVATHCSHYLLHPLGRALAVTGAADRVGLGAHEHLREALEHRAGEVKALLLQLPAF